MTTERDNQEISRCASKGSEAPPVVELGLMAAMIVHEIGNPLTSILASAEAARRWLEDPCPSPKQARASVARLAAEAHRTLSIARALRSLVIPSDEEWGPFDLRVALREALDAAAAEIQAGGARLMTSLTETTSVRGHRVQIQQVLLNLVRNSLEAMADVRPDRRGLIVSSRVDGPEILIAVSDSGDSSQAVDLERMFEPLFTTSPAGLGLGLAISRQIVMTHGGRIWATRNDPDGMTVTFALALGCEKAGPRAHT